MENEKKQNKNITLTEDQQNAADQFAGFLLDDDRKYMVVAGPAGTGKSTLMRHLLDIVHSRIKMYSLLLGKNKKLSIELTATTNKAAHVLQDMTGQYAGTIHSRLNLVPHNNYKTGETTFTPQRGKDVKPIENALVVVDEVSMLNDELYRYIDEYTSHCKVLLVGDQYQLAPVNQTVPIIDTLNCPKAMLTKIMRHGGVIAHEGAKYRGTIDTGVFRPFVANGKEIIHVDGISFKDMIEKEFTDPEYIADKARILAWTNNTVQRYNAHLRSVLGLPEYLCEEDILTANKPVIHKQYGVTHSTDSPVKIHEVQGEGEIHGVKGRWVKLSDDATHFLPYNQLEVAGLLKQLARGKDWQRYFSVKDYWLDLRPVFSSTIHRAQGSTYDRVYINLTDIGKCFVWSDVARMMYVAITRAARQVVLYGQLPYRYSGAFGESFIKEPKLKMKT